MSELLYCFVYVFGVFISAVAQIILKKSAGKTYESRIREYLNVKVIFSYGIFFAATMCTIFAYKKVPLSLGAILGTVEYFFIAVLSYIFLKERISAKKAVGLCVIIVGVIIYSLNTISPEVVQSGTALLKSIFVK